MPDFDITEYAKPKSDQVNADDFIRPLTVTITDVAPVAGEQPVKITLAECKPYFPCKSMIRALIKCWGPKTGAYIGRQMVLFCDDAVKWGGKPVGGVRISHVSHIDKPVKFPMTMSKGVSKMYTVDVLTAANAPVKQPPANWDEWAQRAGMTYDEMREKAGFDDLAEDRQARIYADPEAFAKWAAEKDPESR